MQGLLFTAALLAAGVVGFGNFGMRAQDTGAQGARSQDFSAEQGPEQAGVFDRWLKPNAPECVPVSDVGVAANQAYAGAVPVRTSALYRHSSGVAGASSRR